MSMPWLFCERFLGGIVVFLGGYDFTAAKRAEENLHEAQAGSPPTARLRRLVSSQP